MQSIGTEYVSGNLREQFGIVAAVIGNADTYVIPRYLLKNIVGQPLGSHPDGIFVHPVGPDSHDAPEASGSELQSLVESVLEPRRIIVPQFDHLHLSLLIEIPFQPFPGVLVVILCHSILVLLSCLLPYGLTVKPYNLQIYSNYLASRMQGTTILHLPQKVWVFSAENTSLSQTTDTLKRHPQPSISNHCG